MNAALGLKLIFNILSMKEKFAKIYSTIDWVHRDILIKTLQEGYLSAKFGR